MSESITIPTYPEGIRKRLEEYSGRLTLQKETFREGSYDGAKALKVTRQGLDDLLDHFPNGLHRELVHLDDGD